MITNTISSGVTHSVPHDVRKLLISHQNVHEVWEDITPLARNEWICWIENAKKIETRNRRIKIMSENLVAGKRRPCCFAGRTHR
jgi:uncharacterized protein YdeI (YjbR/CyaY-like superfamily)